MEEKKKLLDEFMIFQLKDIALLKTAMFSMGIFVGTKILKSQKKTVANVSAVCAFVTGGAFLYLNKEKLTNLLYNILLDEEEMFLEEDEDDTIEDYEIEVAQDFFNFNEEGHLDSAINEAGIEDEGDASKTIEEMKKRMQFFQKEN